MDYNTFFVGKDITTKTLMKREVFDNMYWVILPQEIQFERMVKLAVNLLSINDTWAYEKMRVRRNNRRFISPRRKTMKVWK